MDDALSTLMTCRPGCGACCIAPSLSSPLPGMPEGKPAGARCIQLSTENRCMLFGKPERPAVCASFPVMAEHCGSDRDEALARLGELERMTARVPLGRRPDMNAWRYLDTGPASGADNMAMDEMLLAEAVKGSASPILRFYTWDPPAVSLGRFQDKANSVNAVACRKHGIDIVRRITGGRAVLHRHELTYSVISPIDNDFFPNDVLGTYKVLASGLLAGLVRLGVPAEIVSPSGDRAGMVQRDPKEAACFASPSWYEILVHGRKIVGSAQRRLAGAFLQHGSILIDHDPRLEAEVIPQSCMKDVVTCINRETGRAVPIDEVKLAFRSGFSEALGVSIR